MALYGLANVIKQPIYSINPENKSTFIRDIPKCNHTIYAITSWIIKEENK
jgi:hypothetical protein